MNLDDARAELSNLAADRARKDGDLVMIHLLAAAEEAAQRGENAIAGHLLLLAGFRSAGRDKHVCAALAPTLRDFGRVLHGDESFCSLPLATGAG